jgi:hypothetical protein
VQAHAANAWIVSPVMPFECAKAGCPNAATHLLLVRIVSEDEAGRLASGRVVPRRCAMNTSRKLATRRSRRASRSPRSG